MLSVSSVTESERDEDGRDTAHTLLEQCHLQERHGRDCPFCQLCMDTLCREKHFISDIYEELAYIFVFGYYLRRDFAATLVCTIPNMDGHK